MMPLSVMAHGSHLNPPPKSGPICVVDLSEKEEKKNVGKGRREGEDNAGGKKNNNEYHQNTNFEIYSFGVHPPTPHPTPDRNNRTS